MGIEKYFSVGKRFASVGGLIWVLAGCGTMMDIPKRAAEEVITAAYRMTELPLVIMPWLKSEPPINGCIKTSRGGYMGQGQCTTCGTKMSAMMSPLFLSNSHISTMTTSSGRNQSFLFNLPGTLQFLIFPSKHRTIILFPPSRCSIIPINSPFPGSLTLVIFCSSFSFLIHTQKRQSL